MNLQKQSIPLLILASTTLVIAQSNAPADLPRTERVPASNSDISPTYRIGEGDVLQINVWKEAEASVPAVTVRSDGFISIPLVKEVKAAGMTVPELERMLTEKLSRFIQDPDITVVLKEVISEKIYVIGAVRKEGPITLRTPLTVLQAVAEAGGVTEYAKKSKMYVLRVENNKQVRLPVDYQALLKGDGNGNLLLRPKDTLVVPQ